MEARLTEKVKQYGALRAAGIDFLYKYVPKAGFENNAVFHSLLVVCTVVVIISIFATTRRLTLFSLHPVCMTIGVVIFLAEGIASYRNNALLDFLSPIMQHNKKMKVRAIHQTMQTTGGVFLALGLLFIAAHKLELGKSLIPMSVHSITAVTALSMVIVQIVSGQDKMANLEHNNRRVHRWHGDTGLLAWDLLCLTICLGLLSFLPLSIGTPVVLLSVLSVWLTVHSQLLGRPALHKYDSAYDMDGSGDALNSSAAAQVVDAAVRVVVLCQCIYGHSTCIDLLSQLLLISCSLSAAFGRALVHVALQLFVTLTTP
jgi:uncharacterized membrane protein